MLNVGPSEYCYTTIYINIYITRTDIEHHFSQLSRVELFYRNEPFIKIKNVSSVETRKKCYIFKIGEQSL